MTLQYERFTNYRLIVADLDFANDGGPELLQVVFEECFCHFARLFVANGHCMNKHRFSSVNQLASQAWLLRSDHGIACRSYLSTGFLLQVEGPDHQEPFHIIIYEAKREQLRLTSWEEEKSADLVRVLVHLVLGPAALLVA